MVGFDKMITSQEKEKLCLKNKMLAQMLAKSKIEAEIKQFSDVLSSNNIGMSEPLVDREGFPRNDIDVYQVRNARHKIICLQNDHKSTMAEIEASLHELHMVSATDSTSDVTMEQEWPQPFARVTLVSAGSPADLCGLHLNDLVLGFGSVNKSNFKSMQDIAGVVHHSNNQKVEVVVKREGRRSPLYLDLFPRTWSGQGLLGCKIDPLPVEPVER